MTIDDPAASSDIAEIEALRRPLTGYCYRILGSATDADDAVQETLIRVVTKWSQFDESRSRLTTWAHRIATNVCLDMLRAGRRRALLVDAATTGELGDPLPADRWIEPMPDGRILPDPADTAVARESVRLAFVAALQWLPPRQRAVLVLRDVLAFSTQETAEILETSVPSVTSAVQRARATLAARSPHPYDLDEPDDPEQRELLRRYVAAFESHDVAELTAVLRADAVTGMPPFAWRIDGGPRIAGLVAASDSCAGARLLPCRINGSAGFGQYRPSGDGTFQAFALVAVDLRDGLIGRMITFLGTADRFAEFGLPTRLDR